MSRKLAIITARAGSKRIPNKNIRNFCGKPIISYGIEAAKESKIFDTIMVSTDSEEIAQIGLKYGAEIPFFRSEENSDDYATTRDVIMEVLDRYKDKGEEFDVICCIYPTAPFITAELLQQGLQLLSNDESYHVYPVVRYSFPPQRGVLVDNGYIDLWQPKYQPCRSQDLEPIYHDCGMFYFYDVKEYFRTNGQIVNKVKPIILPETLVQDIDTEDDWKIAELKYKLWKKESL